MAKSPLAKNSKTVKHVRNSKNVIPLHLTIPYQGGINREATEFDVSHLLHLGADRNNDKIDSRIPYLRSFCKKASQYVDNGRSVITLSKYYEVLRAFIAFCDAINVDPFSEAGYLKYAGNDGELRHRIKMYSPSKKLWKMSHGDELGIQESSACSIVSCLRTALSWCGLPTDALANQHRGFAGEKNPFKGYSPEEEEDTLVTRLSELFFTLAPQLIAAKNEKLVLPDELPVVIDLGGHQEIISIKTSLKTQTHGRSKSGTSAKPSAAFNMAMGAAYHLMCFFTSLNDSDVQSIAHPITIHTDERDKSLQVVKVSSN